MRISSDALAAEDLARLACELTIHVSSKIWPKNALQKLANSGCDPNAILLGLYQYCCLNLESIQKTKRDLSRKNHRIARLARILAEASKEIAFAEGVLREHGFICNCVPDTDSLLGYSDLLGRIANSCLARMSSKRAPARDIFLVYVSQVVRKATAKPYFKELALLVNSLRRVYRPETDEVATEAIEKRIRRYGLLEEDEMMAIARALESGPKSPPDFVAAILPILPTGPLARDAK